MSSDKIIIAGATGGVAVRQEINDFIADEKFFTLYIRALSNTQAIDETKDGSSFGISGIHGQPFVSWNGAVGDFAPGKWDFGGYCTHGSPLFPTWHRPYVLLVEQIIQQEAIKVAQQFRVNQQDWQTAATQLRFPFWDWAKNSVPPDVVINSPSVTIIDYDGQKIQVDNPLMRYRFQNPAPFTAPWDQYTETVRYPDGEGNENIDELKSTLADAQEQTTDDTIALLHMVPDWPNFSNHRDSADSQTNSLETIHDQIHVEVGGNGHMSDPAVAAFDPIFFLHHCNVDRLFSIWSALHPGVEVDKEQNDKAGTFTFAPDTMVDSKTDLTPFWESSNAFWKSENLYDAKKHYYNTDKLGYVYPALSETDRNNHKEVQQAAKKVIHRLMAKPQNSIFKGDPAVNQWWNWSVRIRVRKFELGRSFIVLVFLGSVPANPAEWLTSEHLVGKNHIFANSASGSCENCRRQNNLIHEGFIHLNRGFGRLAPQITTPFKSEVVVPYLKENLQWRVVDTAKQPVQIQSLDIAAISVTLSSEANEIVPKVGERTVHYDVTAGRHDH